jgi:hypothetical protein
MTVEYHKYLQFFKEQELAFIRAEYMKERSRMSSKIWGFEVTSSIAIISSVGSGPSKSPHQSHLPLSVALESAPQADNKLHSAENIGVGGGGAT